MLLLRCLLGILFVCIVITVYYATILGRRTVAPLEPEPVVRIPVEDVKKIILDMNTGPYHLTNRLQNCRVKNCLVTRNRSYFGSEDDFGKFDVVVFDGRGPRDNIPDYVDRLRRPNQVFIFKQVDLPINLIQRAKPDIHNVYRKDFYNATWSYRRKSDIFMFWGQLIPNTEEAEKMYYENEGKYVQWTYENYNESNFLETLSSRSEDFLALSKRPKKIAWLVSNCQGTHSKRELYVEELQKHIQVDIIGGCGPLDCPKTGNQKIGCQKMIAQEYKFYLAFENAFTEDFISEKLYQRSLDSKLLPIVMGAGNYSDVLPTHSYLNVMDFESPKALADHINFLDENDTEYLSYFWWHGRYKLMYYRSVDWDGPCAFCARVNSPGFGQKTIRDIWRWEFQARNGRDVFQHDPYPWEKKS